DTPRGGPPGAPPRRRPAVTRRPEPGRRATRSQRFERVLATRERMLRGPGGQRGDNALAEPQCNRPVGDVERELALVGLRAAEAVALVEALDVAGQDPARPLPGGDGLDLALDLHRALPPRGSTGDGPGDPTVAGWIGRGGTCDTRRRWRSG